MSLQRRKLKDNSESALRVDQNMLLNDDEPHDILKIRVLHLVSSDNVDSLYRLRITYFRHLLLDTNIRSQDSRSTVQKSSDDCIGEFKFDASDFERVCAMVDQPLVVTVEPFGHRSSSAVAGNLGATRTFVTDSLKRTSTVATTGLSDVGFVGAGSQQAIDVNICYIDMLPILTGADEKWCARKRLEPILEPNVIFRKSWENLPMITLELSIEKNPLNTKHNDVLKKVNAVEITVLGAYNLPWIFTNKLTYTVGTQLPVLRQKEYTIATFERGHSPSHNPLSGYVEWESLRRDSRRKVRSDRKMEWSLSDIRTDVTLNLENYVNNKHKNAAEWNSFHRSLIEPEGGELPARLLKYKWPVEMLIQGELKNVHLMAFVNLFQLLHTGEDHVCAAVELRWFNADEMLQNTGCQPLLNPSYAPVPQSRSISTKRGRSVNDVTSDTSGLVQVCGEDGEPSFIVLEFRLTKPLRESCIPPHITEKEMSEMLEQMEKSGDTARVCTGRAREGEWAVTVKRAALALSLVRIAGANDVCTLDRQLSSSRTRVEVASSLLQAAALYINDRFLLPNYVDTEDNYKELLILAHACLVHKASTTLDVGQEIARSRARHANRRAARNARQMRDLQQAEKIYMECVIDTPNDDGAWRELGICLMDSSPVRANVCLRRALELNPRHPLTLLSLGSQLMEETLEIAEPFFVALVSLYPTWLPGWVAAHLYFLKRELFKTADNLLDIAVNISSMTRSNWMLWVRDWEFELGDWWDPTPLCTPYSIYLDTADLLLRLRAISLAEVCLAQELIVNGESAPYLHLLALCFILRGDAETALCHLRKAREKTPYLLALRAACLLKLGDPSGALEVYTQAIRFDGTFTAGDGPLKTAILEPNPMRSRVMLLELVRRTPCAQVWLALADTWVANAEFTEAECCATEALRCDRHSARGWDMLARLLLRRGRKARATFCREMAEHFGWKYAKSNKVVSQMKNPIDELVAKNLAKCECADEVDIISDTPKYHVALYSNGQKH